jgi:hypothetical protein
MRLDKKGEVEVTAFPKQGERYYGIEIELESRTSSLDAKTMLESVTPKLQELGFVSGTDGSVQNGAEFRSCPQTYPVLKANLAKFLDVVSPYFIAKSNCGVHIHVSRSSLSELQLAKIIGFVYNPANRDFITSISRRPSGRWQEFTSGSFFNWSTTPEGKLKVGVNKGKLTIKGVKYCSARKKKIRIFGATTHKVGKYTAVNTLHEHTVEFRLFAGADNLNIILSYLQFVDALCAYTQTGAVNLPLNKIIHYYNFLGWMQEGCVSQYKELYLEYFSQTDSQNQQQA